MPAGPRLLDPSESQPTGVGGDPAQAWWNSGPDASGAAQLEERSWGEDDARPSPSEVRCAGVGRRHRLARNERVEARRSAGAGTSPARQEGVRGAARHEVCGGPRPPVRTVLVRQMLQHEPGTRRQARID
ncbi:unnamed protein product [Urochloa humidicola]